MFARGIFMLVGLGIIGILVAYMTIPAPFGLIIHILLFLAAIYIIAVMFRLIPGPPWFNSGPPI